MKKESEEKGGRSSQDFDDATSAFTAAPAGTATRAKERE